MRGYFFLLLLIFGISVSGANGVVDDYAVSKIPASLLKNANAVLRLEQLKFELYSAKEAIFTNHYVITVLNEKGEHWAQLSEYYDKHRSVESVEGVLYDATGKIIRKMKNKELQDVSGVDDNNLIDDNRVKQHNFYHKVFPYTIEYVVVIKYKSTLFFPGWVPQGGEHLSVEKSSVTYIVPENYSLRYRMWNYKGEPVTITDKGKKMRTWTASDMPAIQREPNAPDWHELTTYIAFAPSEFQVDDYRGNMSNWNDFGKFVYALKAGRDELPDETKQKIHQLGVGVRDQKEKIRVLYEFMQKHTRYISIQLGIGGWQPFAATFVAGKGYGDCKALTNYMYAILKEAGIKSYYTIIRAGRGSGRINDDFPSQQFNHVILCVPVQQDTVWLECTSQVQPAGYLGDFTCDRFALLIDENGGALIRTPKYGLKENLQHRVVKAKLDETGELVIHSTTDYKAMQQDFLYGMINALSKEKQKEYLQRRMDFATYDITGFNYTQVKSTLPVINEILDMSVQNYAVITGKRLFIIPNIMSRNTQKPNSPGERKYDFQLSYAYCDSDSVEIELPAGYEAESLPEDTKIESPFGKYFSAVKLTGNKMTYFRKYEQFSGRYAASEYKNWISFHEAVFKSDNTKVVLVKKEGALKAF